MYAQPIFGNLKEYIIQKYNCHTIILYGSYSRNDFTEESDVDIVCFSDVATEDKNDVDMYEGKQLDVWIYPTEKMNHPEQFLRILKGVLWLDDKGRAEAFLSNIQRLFDEGPPKLSNDQKNFLKAWMRKMHLRSIKNDIEGNFRYHWMLKDSLEIYFELKGLWYLGPKLSFQWLKENDTTAYELFDLALAAEAQSKNIKQLINYIEKI